MILCGFTVPMLHITAEIARTAEWDIVKPNIFFAWTAIRYIQHLPAAKLLKTVVVPFELEALGE